MHRTLLEPELIPVVDVPEPPKAAEEAPSGSPFLLRPKAGAVSDKGSPMTAGKQESAEVAPEEKNEDYFLKKMRERVLVLP